MLINGLIHCAAQNLAYVNKYMYNDDVVVFQLNYMLLHNLVEVVGVYSERIHERIFQLESWNVLSIYKIEALIAR